MCVSHNTVASTKYFKWKKEKGPVTWKLPIHQNCNSWQTQHKATTQKHLSSSFCPNTEWSKAVNPVLVYILLTD